MTKTQMALRSARDAVLGIAAACAIIVTLAATHGGSVTINLCVTEPACEEMHDAVSKAGQHP